MRHDFAADFFGDLASAHFQRHVYLLLHLIGPALGLAFQHGCARFPPGRPHLLGLFFPARASAQNGQLFSVDGCGTAIYMVTLSVTFEQFYPDEFK